jgi:hypothetical protein
VNGRRPSDRTFGVVLATLFVVVALIGWLLAGHILAWALGISGALLFVALVAPTCLMPLNRIWVWLGHRIATTMNYVLLGSFFYLVITPFGVVARVFRMISVTKGPDDGVDTYWSTVGRRATVESYPDMF